MFCTVNLSLLMPEFVTITVQHGRNFVVYINNNTQIAEGKHQYSQLLPVSVFLCGSLVVFLVL